MREVRPTAKQTPTCPTCKRKMQFHGWRSFKEFTFSCGFTAKLAKLFKHPRTTIHDRVEAAVPLTAVQLKRIKAYNKWMWKGAGNVHKVGHAFQRSVPVAAWLRMRECALLMVTSKSRKSKAIWTKMFKAAQKECGDTTIRDMLNKAERAAKRHKSIINVTVDDDHFCSSSLMLISAETKDRYMGASVYHFPQCGGSPTHFFLYPSHVDELIKALRVLQVKAKRKPSH